MSHKNLKLKDHASLILQTMGITNMQAIAHPPLLRDIENGTGKTITQKFKIKSLGTLEISGSAITVYFILLFF
ncbi:hypothetical protein N8535_01105 [bacterium]|nr:hypothetical protein [bacterium]